MPVGSFGEVLLTFLRLGLTSFGGPVAHLGYFRSEIVERRKWVDEATYADLVVLCQFLPGPASSQVGMALGITRAGLRGGLAAWLGFTLPSALLMLACAYGVAALPTEADLGWLRGLKIVAVAVVAQAVWGMARTLCPDRPRATIALVAAAIALLWPAALGQVVIIVLAGLLGRRLFTATVDVVAVTRTSRTIGRGLATASLALFFVLLLVLPLARTALPNLHVLGLIDSFYRAGALVFGGGHVVLPLLQAEVVPPGWLSNEQFVAGYGAAQAVPGPLFTFAAYLGAVAQPTPNGWLGGLIALLSIFLSSWLLIVGALPFWDVLRSRADIQAALRGINAAVVGLLLAALYQPVWTSAIAGPADMALALGAFALLVFWKVPPWLVVVLAAIGGAVL
ncbi:MAG TPA: chromate efflux transporter [Roseiflexaceae bacterium]|nr:chromate efflux transporter [Roseiflexaceae bacterium]